MMVVVFAVARTHRAALCGRPLCRNTARLLEGVVQPKKKDSTIPAARGRLMADTTGVDVLI